jgi:hypothetical protein
MQKRPKNLDSGCSQRGGKSKLCDHSQHQQQAAYSYHQQNAASSMSKMILSSFRMAKATALNATLGVHSLAVRHNNIPLVAIALNVSDGIVSAGRAVGVVPQEEQAAGTRSRTSSIGSARRRAGSFVAARKESLSLLPAALGHTSNDMEVNAIDINSTVGIDSSVIASALPTLTDLFEQAEALQAGTDIGIATNELRGASSVAGVKPATTAGPSEASQRVQRAGASPRASRSPSPRNRPHRAVMASPASALEPMPM